MIQQLEASAIAPSVHCGSVANLIRQGKIEQDPISTAASARGKTDGHVFQGIEPERMIVKTGDLLELLPTGGKK